MKKAIIIVILLISTISFSQATTFVKKYTSYITNVNDVKSKEDTADVTVVFNEKGENVIVMYVNTVVTRYYQVSDVQKGKTTNGTEYQAFECVQELDGKKVMLQLFENNFRIHHGSDFIEFF